MINIWVNNEACRRYFSIDFKCNLCLIPCNRKEVFLMFRALLHIALTSLRFLLHLSRCVTVKSKSNLNLDLTFNLVLKIKHENTWKFWFDIKKNKDILVMSTSAFTPLYPLQSWLWQFRETREQIKQTQMGREES